MKPDVSNKLCITGGSGFIGTNLIRALLRRGQENITVIDLHNLPDDISSSVRFFQGNCSDQALLNKALEPQSIVVHLGGTSNQATSEKDPLQDAEVNIVGAIKLFKAAGEKGVSKIICMSSAPAVYGLQSHSPVSTTALPNPISAHGIMKLAVEHYSRHYARIYQFAFVNLRCVNIYGPGQLAATHGVVSRFIFNVLEHKPIELWGSPHIGRDFLYIGDFIEALQRACNARVHDVTLNIATGREVPLGRLIAIIERATGNKAEVCYRDTRRIDTPTVRFSTEQTKRVLGWKAHTSIEDGVKRTVAWLCEMQQ